MTKSLLAVCPDEGKEKCLQWELHDDGRLDLYWEDVERTYKLEGRQLNTEEEEGEKIQWQKS